MSGLKYKLTDAGNANAFADFTKGNWRYDHRRAKWFRWTGKYWELDEKRSVENVALSAVRSEAVRMFPAGSATDLKTRDEALRWYLRSEDKHRLKAMLELSQSRPEIALKGDEWDRNPWLLGVDNGAVDLCCAEVVPVSRDEFVSMRASVPFDPTAKCPRWQQFLVEIFNGKEELIEYIQRAIGYSLTAQTTEQCFFLCWGEGQNGKSTFLETLKYVLGIYSEVMPFSSFVVRKNSPAIRNDLATLVGKRFVIAKESEKGAALDETVLKELTGSDTIKTRFLYQEFFQFTPVAKIWLAANHKPVIRDQTVSIWRRIHLIPFTQEFRKSENRDETLSEKLRAEAVGILAWAIEGCVLWQLSGLDAPQIVQQAGEGYREESDVASRFLADVCEVGEGRAVPAQVVKEAFKRWAEDNDERASYAEFSQGLKHRGFASHPKGHDKVWHWLGFSLNPAACGPGGCTAGVLAGVGNSAQTLIH